MTPTMPPHPTQMTLRVLLPTGILIDQPVRKIIAEAENGEFCLLPRHIDFVAALVPGVLCFYPPAGGEGFAAIDRGTLVKCGQEVTVSTYRGITGASLEDLQALIEEKFLALDEHERQARTALARLEAGTLRGFLNLKEQPHD